MVGPSLFQGGPVLAWAWNTHFLEGQQEALGWMNMSLRTFPEFCGLCSRTGGLRIMWGAQNRGGVRGSQAHSFPELLKANLLRHPEYVLGATKACGKILNNNNGNNFVLRTIKGNGSGRKKIYHFC